MAVGPLGNTQLVYRHRPHALRDQQQVVAQQAEALLKTLECAGAGWLQAPCHAESLAGSPTQKWFERCPPLGVAISITNAATSGAPRIQAGTSQPRDERVVSMVWILSGELRHSGLWRGVSFAPPQRPSDRTAPPQCVGTVGDTQLVGIAASPDPSAKCKTKSAPFQRRPINFCDFKAVLSSRARQSPPRCGCARSRPEKWRPSEFSRCLR